MEQHASLPYGGQFPCQLDSTQFDGRSQFQLNMPWQQQQPRRNLPMVPTLPSTPAMSRPGSAGSAMGGHQMPKQFPQVKYEDVSPFIPRAARTTTQLPLDCSTPSLPTTPSLSAGSGWGSPDPMLSSMEGDEKLLAFDNPVTPATESSYFSLPQTTLNLQTGSSAPSTPGLTDSSSSSFCNPRELHVSSQAASAQAVSAQAPAFVDVTTDSFDFTFSTDFPGTVPSTTSASVTPELSPATPYSLNVSSPLDLLTGADGDQCGLDKKQNASVPAGSVSPASLNRLSTPESNCPVKTEKRDANQMSSASEDEEQNLMEELTEAEPESPSKAKKLKATDGLAVEDSDDGIIEGPPPQNRRGRKQSFSNDPTKQFACNICKRRFRRQEHLKRHHRSLHTKDKPYRCDECGKSFSRSDNLSQHQRTHGSGSVPLDVIPTMPFGNILFQTAATMPGSGDEGEQPQHGYVMDIHPQVHAPM